MRNIFTFFVIIVCFHLSAKLQATSMSTSFKIMYAELGYPTPSIPFYHFKAELELSDPSIIEVEAIVNGDTLRFVNLYRDDYLVEKDKPSIVHRPPSGYALSKDNTLYLNPFITGWVRWQHDEQYKLEIRVRIKKSVKQSANDKILSAVTSLKAPAGPPVFDSTWKGYKSIVLSETAGIERKNEPIEVLLPFYPDEVTDLKREIRVMAVNPDDYSLDEVPCQIFEIREYLQKDDLAPLSEGEPQRHIPLWMPTTTCKLAFLADIPAKNSVVYMIFYNNNKALTKTYITDLCSQGELPGLIIENNKISVALHPNSGHIDQITLHEIPKFPLYHRMETNGAIHWNPEVYAPPRAWTHSADWKHDQNMNSFSGPVLVTAEFWGNLRNIPEVSASVRYDFYPEVPYFISTTNMRINETLQTLALRNAEIVLKRELITHAAWYDVIRNKVLTFDVINMADLTDLKMEADVPWITFYNEEIGIGFAGINLDYSNTSLESRHSLLNPYFYITGGPWIYWSRALSLSFLSSNMQQVIPALKGSTFSEKWAYLTYKIDKDIPYKPVLEWKEKLTNPIRIQLVEEVDKRVSKSLVEIYVDEGKSGWEERDTGNH